MIRTSYVYNQVPDVVVSVDVVVVDDIDGDDDDEE